MKEVDISEFKRSAGSMKSSMRIGGDIVSLATEENEWDALHD